MRTGGNENIPTKGKELAGEEKTRLHHPRDRVLISSPPVNATEQLVPCQLFSEASEEINSWKMGEVSPALIKTQRMFWHCFPFSLGRR